MIKIRWTALAPAIFVASFGSYLYLEFEDDMSNADSIAVVVETKGDARFRQRDRISWNAAKGGTPLGEGAQMSTGDGTATIRIEGVTELLKLQPRSFVVIVKPSSQSELPFKVLEGNYALEAEDASKRSFKERALSFLKKSSNKETNALRLPLPTKPLGTDEAATGVAGQAAQAVEQSAVPAFLAALESKKLGSGIQFSPAPAATPVPMASPVEEIANQGADAPSPVSTVLALQAKATPGPKPLPAAKPRNETKPVPVVLAEPEVGTLQFIEFALFVDASAKPEELEFAVSEASFGKVPPPSALQWKAANGLVLGQAVVKNAGAGKGVSVLPSNDVLKVLKQLREPQIYQLGWQKSPVVLRVQVVPLFSTNGVSVLAQTPGNWSAVRGGEVWRKAAGNGFYQVTFPVAALKPLSILNWLRGKSFDLGAALPAAARSFVLLGESGILLQIKDVGQGNSLGQQEAVRACAAFKCQIVYEGDTEDYISKNLEGPQLRAKILGTQVVKIRAKGEWTEIDSSTFMSFPSAHELLRAPGSHAFGASVRIVAEPQ